MIGAGLAIPVVATRRRTGSGAIAAPAPSAPFTGFPTLRAAYADGRAILTLLGDSTTFGLGAGSGGFYGASFGANTANPAHAVRAGLNAAGITAIDGCAVFGSRSAASLTGQAALYYGDTATIGSNNWVYASGWSDSSPWGLFAWNNADDTAAGFQPGFAYDRAELFLATPGFSGATATIEAGGIAIETGQLGGHALRKQAVTLPRGGDPLRVRRSSGLLGVGAVRCWDSASAHVQVETLGNPGWTAGDWVATGADYSPLAALPAIGAHAVVITLGLNDRHFGRGVAAFRADLKTIAATLRATGADVLLAIPVPGWPGTGQSSSDYDLDAAWIAAIGGVAAELGLAAPIDLRSIGIGEGDYYDTAVHLNGAGYAKMGAAIAARLLGG